MSSPVKASDVKYESVEFAPEAQCRGVVDRSGDQEMLVKTCSWSYRLPGYGIPIGEVRKQARRHAQWCPGHEVVVEQINRSVYWADRPEPTGITVDNGVETQQLSVEQVLQEDRDKP